MTDIPKIDALVQSSPHPAWLATTRGECLYVNPALKRLTGLKSDQINQVDWRSFVLEEDRAAASASWQRSLASCTPFRTTVRLAAPRLPSPGDRTAFAARRAAPSDRSPRSISESSTERNREKRKGNRNRTQSSFMRCDRLFLTRCHRAGGDWGHCISRERRNTLVRSISRIVGECSDYGRWRG